MKSIATAVLAFFAAAPVAEFLPSTPLGPLVAKLQQSPEVLSLLGEPRLLCLAIYLMFCYGVVELLDTGLGVVASPGPFYVKAGEALPSGNMSASSFPVKGFKDSENLPRPKGSGG